MLPSTSELVVVAAVVVVVDDAGTAVVVISPGAEIVELVPAVEQAPATASTATAGTADMRLSLPIRIYTSFIWDQLTNG